MTAITMASLVILSRAIDEVNFGPAHPNVARHLNNLAVLLKDTNRLWDAEPLMRRALAIRTSHTPVQPRP